MKVFDLRSGVDWSDGGWSKLLARPVYEGSSLENSVRSILGEVKEKGDEAVRHFSGKFDHVSLEKFEASSKEMQEAEVRVPGELKEAIQQACANIELFHKNQVDRVQVIETMPGVQCWRKMLAIQKVGLYIPGGTAPLFSTVLMLGIPARIAGCKERILCSPPDKEGRLQPAILYAAKVAGISKIFKIGGVQAIAALAYGTESIPKVHKIFGPGNQYVTCAKQLVQSEGTAIDMPAGPSELAVYADQSANPAFLAADLLSQAEHGIDSQVLLVCSSTYLSDQVLLQIEQQAKKLARKETAGKALENSKIILVRDEEEAMKLLNEYAPEHLILACENAEELADKVVNAGSVFLGHYSPESAGDYASGTNHTLPTNGYAKAYSGVSLDSFVKKITFQKLSQDGLYRIGKTVKLMAEAEGLGAHAHAITIRLKDYSPSFKD
jgi:histidinol dehydrogenase